MKQKQFESKHLKMCVSLGPTFLMSSKIKITSYYKDESTDYLAGGAAEPYYYTLDYVYTDGTEF